MRFVTILLLAASLLYGQKRPNWVKKAPVDSKYYIGIGAASQDADGADYQKLAQDCALSQIAS